MSCPQTHTYYVHTSLKCTKWKNSHRISKLKTTKKKWREPPVIRPSIELTLSGQINHQLSLLKDCHYLHFSMNVTFAGSLATCCVHWQSFSHSFHVGWCNRCCYAMTIMTVNYNTKHSPACMSVAHPAIACCTSYSFTPTHMLGKISLTINAFEGGESLISKTKCNISWIFNSDHPEPAGDEWMNVCWDQQQTLNAVNDICRDNCYGRSYHNCEM